MGRYVTKRTTGPHVAKGKWVVCFTDRRWGDVLLEYFDKRSDAYAYAKKCRLGIDRCGLHYILRWWSVENDELVGEEKLHLTPEEVHRLFGADSEYPDHPPIFCYTVTASTKNKLGFVRHDIDLNVCDYTVETD